MIGLFSLICIHCSCWSRSEAGDSKSDAASGGRTAQGVKDFETGAALIKTVQELNAVVRDVSMVYEGTSEFVGGAELAGQEPAVLKRGFQGNFLYRHSDSATLLNIYRREINSEYPLTRSVKSFFRGTQQDAEYGPHESLSFGTVEPYRSNVAALNATASPFRFYFPWYFKWISTLSSAKSELSGWEEINGHKCIKVKTVLKSKNPEAKEMVQWFSVDLVRGGHPLRWEYYIGEDLSIRTDDIRLAQFNTSDGAEVWFPVRGTSSTFLWNGKYYKQPVMRESYSVAASTVRINAGIPDRYFTVKNAGQIPGSSSPNPLRQAFELEASRPAPERLATDRVSIQKRLNQELAEADRQAEMIKTSSTSRVSLFGLLNPSAGLVVFGSVVTIFGIWSLRRSRAS